MGDRGAGGRGDGVGTRDADRGPGPVKIPRARKRPSVEGETHALYSILRALNAIEGVQAWRNNRGILRDGNGRPISYGLCNGASDVLGIVECKVLPPEDGFHDHVYVGRFFAFEVKRYGERPTAAQEAFFVVVREFGGAAGWGTCADDARAFIERVRDPRCDR